MLALLLVGACQKTAWQPLAQTELDSGDLERAKRACRVDERLAELVNARSESSEALRKANTNAGKMLVRDDIQLKEKAIYAEIDACMNAEGYARR